MNPVLVTYYGILLLRPLPPLLLQSSTPPPQYLIHSSLAVTHPQTQTMKHGKNMSAKQILCEIIAIHI